MTKAKSQSPDCVPDPQRLAVFKDCLLTYGMDDRNPDSEWPHNVIAKSAVALSCGRFELPTKKPNHDHDAAEVALCRRLSGEVESLMKYAGGLGGNFERYQAYFCVARRGVGPPPAITREVVRDAFGGTIYPPARIVIEPMTKKTSKWLKWATDNASGEDEILIPHREMIRWFLAQEELRSPSFIYIGFEPLDDKNAGCVFPRIAAALTRAGSLVGVGGWMVE